MEINQRFLQMRESIKENVREVFTTVCIHKIFYLAFGIDILEQTTDRKYLPFDSSAQNVHWIGTAARKQHWRRWGGKKFELGIIPMFFCILCHCTLLFWIKTLIFRIEIQTQIQVLKEFRIFEKLGPHFEQRMISLASWMQYCDEFRRLDLADKVWKYFNFSVICEFAKTIILYIKSVFL